MSPASKSKSKDKKSGKDSQKVSNKSSGLGNIASGVTPVSGYNPLLGKFHTIVTAPIYSEASLQVNGRFRNIDGTDDYSGGNIVEYDAVSNNGSWSGESEDHKDKTLFCSLRQEASLGADIDKREKRRQKNEKKHQRQKERRAQELHERCNGFLMSRKLEALAQQLVAMGFAQERATMALILNEGKIEDSVAWLFEAGEGADSCKEHRLDGGNLKIDISDELAQIADMEIRHKCAKQDVERAIVNCEGDLEKAADALRTQKQDSPSSSLKSDETGDPPTPSNDKHNLCTSQNSLRIQPKPIPSTATLQRREEKDSHYTKTIVMNGAATESGSKVLRKAHPSKLEWAKPQQIVMPAADKRWPTLATNPSVSYSLASPLPVTPPVAKIEARYTSAPGSEATKFQHGSVKESVIVMRRPQSANLKQASATPLSLAPPNRLVSGWYPNNVDVEIPNGLSSHMIPITRGMASHNNLSSSNQFSSQLHYQQQSQVLPNNNGMVDLPGANGGNSFWNVMGSSSSTLAVASSLGLFTGLGSNGSSGSSSPVDWKTGSMGQLNYSNIDWSLDRSPRPASGMWMPNNTNGVYDSYTPGDLGSQAAVRPGNGSCGGLGGLQDSGVVASSGETAVGVREWSSPFEEKDLFSLPRQFVSSPSL